MEEAKAKSGLIGLFDILGYQSFLENNEAELATSEVVSIISNVGDSISRFILDLEQVSDEEIRNVIGGIQWLVFSDTILMVLECEPHDITAGFTFFGTAGTLCHHMFDFGLPLRGAITRGKYLLSKSCFAGRAIVEAYQMGTSLNLAACAISEREYGQLKVVAKDQDLESLFDDLLIRYMAPLKGETYKKIPLLNFLICESPSNNSINPDFEQMVLDSFWAHNKDMTLNAELKAKNTISFLRYLKHRMPDFFQSKSA